MSCASICAHAADCSAERRADRPCASGRRQERHGGGAGSARGAHRRRDSAKRRQCGRCRGRGRLRARGDLSARRQSRRRRLHADPPRRGNDTSRSTIARPRRPRSRTKPSSTREGDADPQKSRDSALAIGVPGTVAGLAFAARRYGSGKFTLAQLIAPAIETGARRHAGRRRHRGYRRPTRWRGSRAGRRRQKSFSKPTARRSRSATLWCKRDLANTLEAIAKDGPHAFYDGPIADKIAAAVQAAGGIMTADDLKSYTAFERTPVRGTYRGYDVVSMPPPSSGGVDLIEMLNILEGYDLGHQDDARRAASHGRGHEARLCRSRAVPRRPRQGQGADRRADLQGLRRHLARHHRSGTRDAVERDPRRRHRAARRPQHHALLGGRPLRQRGRPTPIRSISATASAWSRKAPASCSTTSSTISPSKPDAPNAFGLIGYDANAPGPGKRPLSSMTPTIVLKDGKPFLVTGSPGGSRIITAVLQVVLDVIDRGMDIAERGVGAAHSPSMDAGPGVRRARRLARSDRGTASARPQGGADREVHLGQFHRGHAGWVHRRRRSAHPWRARSRLLAFISARARPPWRPWPICRSRRADARRALRASRRPGGSQALSRVLSCRRWRGSCWCRR